MRNKYAHCFWHRIDEDKFVEFKNDIDGSNGHHQILYRFDYNDLIKDKEMIYSINEKLNNLEYVLDDYSFGDT